ncbi:GDNF family receptor alpha-3 [Folsomia candida]|uniref:GDNF family receptor alpha-3 n=1 Tax=Folsomia candida TaxID=158441 RepID=A0A226DH13_FOLCA|nr:GDNF family receptor alpha-3 [Folsomia candida]
MEEDGKHYYLSLFCFAVACSTVTITKCQAALRTLQAFPYFYPTCLCREPMSDPACNTFRDYLFDHPCSFVKEKEKDPYPVDALPTCDYALDVCKKEPKCIQLLRDFRTQCKQSDEQQCKMEDGEMCHDAWTKLRLSPIFGCICPNSNSRCDRIFREVNYNPCVASDPKLALNGSTSALFSLDQHRLAGLSPHMFFSPASLFPPRPGTHLHNHYLPKFRHHHDTAAPHTEHPPPSAALTQSHLMVDESSSLSTPTYAGYPSPPGSFSTSHSGSITVQVISSSHAPDHELESQLETPLYGPQGGHSKPPPFIPQKPRPPYTPAKGGTNIATISSIRTHGSGSVRLPLQATCLTALQSCRRDSACRGLLEQVLHYCDPMRCRQETCMKALQKFYREVESQWALDVAFCLCSSMSPPTTRRQRNSAAAADDDDNDDRWSYYISYYDLHRVPKVMRVKPGAGKEESARKWTYSTCPPVPATLKIFVFHCQPNHSAIHCLLPFPLVSKTDNRHDQCRLAQESLHPACAQRGDLGVNPPSCHSLAESCRAETDCRFRLEEYEQACAVDSVTRKCAGPAIECRNAMIRILGTKLRTSCACNGTDFTQLYDCLGWQRILWVNPCVVESQRDFHRLRATTQVPASPHHNHRVTPTPSHHPVLDTSSSFEGILPGSDLLSTTMGNPRPRVIHTTTTTTQHIPVFTTTVHTRHPNSKNGRNNNNNKNNNGNGHGVVVKEPELGVVALPNNNMDFTTALVGSSETLLVTEEDTTTIATTSTTTARTEPTTTLQPARYCRLHQGNSGDKKIREGQAKRLYRDDIPTCSELCMCELGRPEAAICTVLECLEIKHCYVKTEDEYIHLQPTYIAHRGKCLCYSGRFICEKPAPDTYTLDNGVFLFLGFSTKDEQLLYPITRLLVRDVVDALRQLITPQTRHYFFDEHDPNDTTGLEKLKALNTTECRLGLYKVEGENIIINATVWDEDFSETGMRQPNDQLFQRERKQCLPVLHALRDLINKQHPIIHGHSLLSILKLAAVQDNIPTPEPSSASHSTQAALSSTLFPVLLLLVLQVTLVQVTLGSIKVSPDGGSSKSKLATPSLSDGQEGDLPPPSSNTPTTSTRRRTMITHPHESHLHDLVGWPALSSPSASSPSPTLL